MILVTGASGTVGSEVVRQLSKSGVPFRAAYRDPGKAPIGLAAVAADLNDPKTLTAALRNIEALFLVSPSQPALELNALAAAKDAGVKHIVKLSVWGAEGEDFSFARLHRPVEKAIEASGLSWTLLRPNGFMQNMATYNGAGIRAQGTFYGSTGDARSSSVDVRDIAAVAVAALTQPGHAGQTYTLSGPEALTCSEIAAKLSATTGREIRYVNLTDEQLKQGMTAAGIPGAYADMLLDLNRYYREDHASRITDDLKRVTGREPISFDQYAKENADAFRATVSVATPAA